MLFDYVVGLINMLTEGLITMSLNKQAWNIYELNYYVWAYLERELERDWH